MFFRISPETFISFLFCKCCKHSVKSVTKWLQTNQQSLFIMCFFTANVVGTFLVSKANSSNTNLKIKKEEMQNQWSTCTYDRSLLIFITNMYIRHKHVKQKRNNVCTTKVLAQMLVHKNNKTTLVEQGIRWCNQCKNTVRNDS